MHYASPRHLVGVALLVLTACGPPVIYDTDLRPVRNPLVTASVDNGWLAVDSTDIGIRVVLELRLEGPPETAEYLSLHVPVLHCTVSGQHLPARLLREEPNCPGPRPVRCPEGSSPEECERLAQEQEAEEICVFTIRAEFLFDEMPHLDENRHYFTFAQSDKPVRWAKAGRRP